MKRLQIWSKLLLIAGALANTGGPVSTGYSEFLLEDPLPKLLPDILPKSAAGGASVLTLPWKMISLEKPA